MSDAITLKHIHDDILALRKEMEEIKETITTTSIENEDLLNLIVAGSSFDFLNEDKELYSEKDLIERYT